MSQKEHMRSSWVQKQKRRSFEAFVAQISMDLKVPRRTTVSCIVSRMKIHEKADRMHIATDISDAEFRNGSLKRLKICCVLILNESTCIFVSTPLRKMNGNNFISRLTLRNATNGLVLVDVPSFKRCCTFEKQG